MNLRKFQPAAITLMITATTFTLTTLGVTAPGVAATTPRTTSAPPINETDPVGDVHLSGLHAPPSAALRKSIDLKDARAVAHESTVRFSVKISRYIKDAKFDQMVFFSLVPLDSNLTPWTRVDLGWSPQHQRSHGYVTATNDSDYRTCVPTAIGANARTDVVWADMPIRCLAPGRVTVTVSTMTGMYRTDAPILSSDKLVVRGARTLYDPAS